MPAAPWARGATRRTATRIAELDAVAEAQQIGWLLGSREFPWDFETALSLALFRTYASPEISVVLDATREFADRPQKRFDDTELVLAWIAKDGVDGPDGRTALRRMNAMHAAFDLDRDDLYYVLTTLICEPIRWLNRWGWRPLTAHEQRAHLHNYLELGRHVGLGDLSDDLADHMAANRAYERDRFRFHPANVRVAEANVAMFLDQHRVPGPLRRAGELVIRALLDRPLLDAFGWDPAPAPVVTAVDSALRLRARIQRVLLPERRTPYDHTRVARVTYPHGHRVAELGTFPDDVTRRRVAAARADLAAG